MKTYTFLFTFLIAGLAMSFSVIHDGYHIGDKVEEFKMMNWDGESIAMSDFDHTEGIIIAFTCNTCPYAVMYEDRLIELHNTYAPQGYPVVAINPNDPEVKEGDSVEAMGKRAEEKKFPFVYLFDEGQKVYPKFGATKTPHIFLLDKERVVRYIGSIDDSPKDAAEVEETYLEDAIAALQKGENPDPAETKAIGCSIKTK